MSKTKKYNVKPEGLGSFFYEIGFKEKYSKGTTIDFEYELFYSGRQALLYILKEVCSRQSVDKIWLPKYYCQHVTKWIEYSYKNIYFYNINPFEFPAVLDVSSFASKNDIVIINNYWGISDTICKKSKDAIIIEDHSHGWLSKSCLNSKADYCFSSLRKSLPIPLGGICWRPANKMKINNNWLEEDLSFYANWEEIRKAMKTKNDFRSKPSTALKENYLKIIIETENFLHKNHSLVKLKPEHKRIINHFIELDVLKYKSLNLDYLYNGIKEVDDMKIIKRKTFTTFGLSLLFKDSAVLESLRVSLIRHSIYPSILWPNNTQDFDWNFFMNIHVDFRYNYDDMNYIKETINSWSTKRK